MLRVRDARCEVPPEAASFFCQARYVVMPPRAPATGPLAAPSGRGQLAHVSFGFGSCCVGKKQGVLLFFPGRIGKARLLARKAQKEILFARFFVLLVGGEGNHVNREVEIWSIYT